MQDPDDDTERNCIEWYMPLVFFLIDDLEFIEQAVVYSTLPQEYSTLTFKGEVVAVDGRVGERSEVIYWHRGDMVIYYR